MIILINFLSGCATHVSKPVVSVSQEQKGLLYFLPKRTVKLVASQTPVDEKSIVTLKTKVEKAKESLKTAKAADLAAKQALEQLEGWQVVIDEFGNNTKLVDGVELDLSVLLTKRVELANAKKKKKATDKALKEAQQSIKALEAQLEETQIAFNSMSPLFKLAISLNDMEPDINHPYRLNFSHNIFRDDDFKVSVNTRGLLSTGSNESVGRADDVISELGGIILALENPSSLLLQAQNGGSQNAKDVTLPTAEKASNQQLRIPTCPKSIEQAYKVELIFDPLDSKNIERVNEKLAPCFPYQIQVMSTNYNDVENMEYVVTSEGSNENFNLKKHKPKINTSVNGIVYRPEYPFQIIVEECKGKIVPINGNQNAFSSCDPEMQKSDVIARQLQLKEYNNKIKSYVKLAKKMKVQLKTVENELSEKAREKLKDNLAIFQSDILLPFSQAFTQAPLSNINIDDELTQILTADIGDIDDISDIKEKDVREKINEVMSLLKTNLTNLQTISGNVLYNWFVYPEDKEPVISQSQLVMLPNKSDMTFIPMRASMLGKSKQSLTFKDGIVTEWSYAQSSELLEVVRIPLEILTKAVDALPLKLKYDNAKAEEVKAKQNLLLSQQTLQALKSCLENANSIEDFEENQTANKTCVEQYTVAVEEVSDEAEEE